MKASTCRLTESSASFMAQLLSAGSRTDTSARRSGTLRRTARRSRRWRRGQHFGTLAGADADRHLALGDLVTLQYVDHVAGGRRTTLAPHDDAVARREDDARRDAAAGRPVRCRRAGPPMPRRHDCWCRPSAAPPIVPVTVSPAAPAGQRDREPVLNCPDSRSGNGSTTRMRSLPTMVTIGCRVRRSRRPRSAAARRSHRPGS